MKTRLFSFTLSALAALLILSLVPAFAATPGSLKFNLTEPALVAGNALAPGEYSARFLDTGSDTPVLKIESGDGFSILVPVMRVDIADGDDAPHVTLSRQDGTLHLTVFQFAGESRGYVVITR